MRIPHFIPFSALLLFSCTNSLLDIEEPVEVPELVVPDPPKDTLETNLIAITGPDSLEPIHREHIQGLTNLRIKPNGRIIARLENDICVHCSSEKFGSWRYVGLEIKPGYDIKPVKHHPNYREIWDGSHKLATVYDTLKLRAFGGTQYGESDNFIEGYVVQDRINSKTIAERNLEASIQHGELSLDSLMSFLWNFDFENGAHPQQSGDSIQAFFMNPAYVDGLYAPERMTLIFLNEELVAVKHNRPLNLPGKRNYTCDYSNTLTLLPLWNEERARAFVSLFVDCAL